MNNCKSNACHISNMSLEAIAHMHLVVVATRRVCGGKQEIQSIICFGKDLRFPACGHITVARFSESDSH